MVGEIDEETDLILTIFAIILSIVIVFDSLYFCYYGVIKPQCKKLKNKFGKTQ